MKQEYVIQAVKTMGLDPQVIKSIQMDTEEVVVEYFVTDSYGNRKRLPHLSRTPS